MPPPVPGHTVPGPHFPPRPATLFGPSCTLPSQVPKHFPDLQRNLHGPATVLDPQSRPHCHRSSAVLSPVPSCAVPGPQPYRPRSSATPSPVRIPFRDLRRFLPFHALCRPRSPNISRTCNVTSTDLQRFSIPRVGPTVTGPRPYRPRSPALPAPVPKHFPDLRRNLHGPATVLDPQSPFSSPVLGHTVPGPHFLPGPATLFALPCALPSQVHKHFPDLRRNLH